MKVANWRVFPDAVKARRFWEGLDPTIRARIERELVRSPFWDSEKRKARDHLKGKFHCNREYRNLANNARIFYSVDKQERLIRLLWGGPHP